MPMFDLVGEALGWLSTLFVFAIGVLVALAAIAFTIDLLQTTDAVRRNYPLIGRFRHLFTALGEFFRQYFFAMDREEMPFNRAEREWAYRAAEGDKNTIAFGSTKNLTPVGTPIFINCPFPLLDEEISPPEKQIIGPYCDQPYEPNSLINISAMSYGSLSRMAVKALSKGAARAGCWLNTGEGGLSPHHLSGACDIVFQIGTAKYGVRDLEGALSDDRLKELASIDQVKMFEIKLSQGAKPGKGGILPAVKVTAEISSIRGIAVGTASISPNRHLDINSVTDLLDRIDHIRSVTGKPVGFKTVIGAYGWLEELCEEVQARGIQSAPDFITIDSGDGGTGAAPMPLMDSVGLPIKESLPMAVDLLQRYGVRDRIKLIASGKLITPTHVAWAFCAGADFVNTARGAMFSLGCIQALKCNKNTCPTGITTHDARLQHGIVPKEKAKRVENYIRNLEREVTTIAHSCGVSDPRKLKRKHVRIVQQDGRSIPMDTLHPGQM